MAPTSGATCQGPASSIPFSLHDRHIDPSDQEPGGEEAVPGTITEADLRGGVESKGGVITDAISGILDRPNYPRQFLLYVQCSWIGDAYLAVALHRDKGLRAHKSLDPWLGFLEGLQYRGSVTVIRDDDERVSRLELVGLD